MSFNIPTEFRLLMQHVANSFQIVHLADFSAAATKAFQKGVFDARFFVEPSLVVDIAESLHGRGKKGALRGWRLYPSKQTLHDALWSFDFCLAGALTTLRAAAVQGSDFDFNRNTKSMVDDLRATHNLTGIRPVPRRHESQVKFIKKFEGYKGEHQLALLTKISYDSVIYAESEQSISPDYTLISAIYNFGLLCAEHHNNTTLKSTLLTVYQKFGSTMFNPDNGEEMLAIARQHELFAVLEVVHPFLFSSTERFEASLNKKDNDQTSACDSDLDDIYRELDEEELALRDKSESSFLVQQANYLESVRASLSPLFSA